MTDGRKSENEQQNAADGSCDLTLIEPEEMAELVNKHASEGWDQHRKKVEAERKAKEEQENRTFIATINQIPGLVQKESARGNKGGKIRLWDVPKSDIDTRGYGSVVAGANDLKGVSKKVFGYCESAKLKPTISTARVRGDGNDGCAIYIEWAHLAKAASYDQLQ